MMKHPLLDSSVIYFIGNVLKGNYRSDAWQSLGFRYIYGLDQRMRMGAGQDFSCQ
jgi:hypothetical protein